MFAFSGVLNRPPGEKRDPAFLEYAVSLAAGDRKKRVCFIPTATGDSPSAIEAVTGIFAGREDVDFSVLTLFTQPSVPDAGAHLTAQDVLLVGGGRFLWVSMTPLDSPVVPEEYGRATTSSGPTGTCAASGAPADKT